MKALNALVSFVLELAMLGALAYWGFHSSNTLPVRGLLGIGIPVLVIVFWAYFMAPNSDHRLPWPWVPVVALVLFLVSAAALYGAGVYKAAVILALVSIVNCSLVFVWHQE